MSKRSAILRRSMISLLEAASGVLGSDIAWMQLLTKGQRTYEARTVYEIAIKQSKNVDKMTEAVNALIVAIDSVLDEEKEEAAELRKLRSRLDTLVKSRRLIGFRGPNQEL